jgi:hypothetical protein
MPIKVTAAERNKHDTRVVKTKPAGKLSMGYNWWKAKSKAELQFQVLDTFNFLKEQQQYRFRQASIHSRLYSNIPLANYAGSTLNQLGKTNNLPSDRPTMNVIQSCIDTLVSKITQSRPKPMFLTDGGNYKARKLAKSMTSFIAGELYQTDAYELAEIILRDAASLGTGCIKIFEKDEKVHLERTLLTELLVDNNDAFYGQPRTLYQMKLIDRSVLAEMLPTERNTIQKAEQAYPDSSGDAQKTMSDMVMVVEAWHLQSGPDANDGRHVIACSSGTILDEDYTKDDFPFVFLHYSPRVVGFWAQSLSEQLTGTQIEINKLLVTISKSISLVGVPRVFVEDGSKVVKAHLNNEVGSIITYRGTKPEYEVAPSVHPELYQQLQRLVDYAYQQSGISALAAASQKPAGLNSGEAIRNFNDIQTDRFAVLNKRYDNLFIDLAYKIVDVASDIAERTGKYQTVYPSKDGIMEVDLADTKLLKDPFAIQCFDSNALPKDPAGRKQAIVEDMQSGILSLQEGRRLLNYSDLEQDDKLAMAAEERILMILDEIVEDGKYTPPDPFMDIQIAKTKVVQYYNLYVAQGLEESRAEMLRDWQAQVLALEAASMPPPMPGMDMAAQGGAPAVPQAPPVSDLMPMAQ